MFIKLLGWSKNDHPSRSYLVYTTERLLAAIRRAFSGSPIQSAFPIQTVAQRGWFPFIRSGHSTHLSRETGTGKRSITSLPSTSSGWCPLGTTFNQLMPSGKSLTILQAFWQAKQPTQRSKSIIIAILAISHRLNFHQTAARRAHCRCAKLWVGWFGTYEHVWIRR